MAFVNFPLVLGGLLIGIPVILHLVMRQQPRHLLFPAIRFVKQRRETNRRNLQLRHWLLLALRCLAIGLLALALARPSVSSAVFGNWVVILALVLVLVFVSILLILSLAQRRGRLVAGVLGSMAAVVLATLAWMLAATLRGDSTIPVGDQEAPVAAVLVFDTSPRMQYRHQNKTRLQLAQEMANWLIRELPEESEIAIVDSRAGSSLLASDLGSASKAIARLQTTAVPRPWYDVLDESLGLARESKLGRREVYVFTDMAQASWNPHAGDLFRQHLAEMDDILLHVIDVGVETPQNFALGTLELSGQRLPHNAALEVAADVLHQGPGETRTIELYLEEPDLTRPRIEDGKPLVPELRSRGRQLCQLEPNGTHRVRFVVQGIERGVHQGLVRIAGGDGLSFDDQRYFTVEVREAWRVLIVAPPDVNSALLVEMLAPYERRRAEQARFDIEERDVIRPSDMANRKLDEYAAVCLLDPGPLTPVAWEQLAGYVERGGGLAIFLGHNAQPFASFNVDQAQQLLPGRLVRQSRSATGDLLLEPRALDHPVLADFARYPQESIPWHLNLIFKRWDVDRVTPDSRVILAFADRAPALVDRPWGRGHVLTMMTPVTEVPAQTGWDPWNEFEVDWLRYKLVNEVFDYLVESGDSVLNFETGQPVNLAYDEQTEPERYLLFTPEGETQELVPRDDTLTVRFTEVPGPYRLRGNRAGPVVRGFAVNAPAELSDLTRLSPDNLDAALGENRYHFARNQEEIEFGVRETRLGREFYPYLIALLALMLGLEHLLGNRFYKKAEVGS